jgi:hypothetical protein
MALVNHVRVFSFLDFRHFGEHDLRGDAALAINLCPIISTYQKVGENEYDWQ